MNTATIVQELWNYCNVLRDDGLIRKHQPVSREDIDRLLLDKLPEVLSEAQKRNRIHNLLRQLAAAGQIQNDGSRRFPRWVLLGEGNNQ